MCRRIDIQMPEEDKRLSDIYFSQSELTLIDVIKKFASDEYKAMILKDNPHALD